MATDPFLDLGTPGGSCRREYERRKAKREAAMRAKHPRVGGLLLKLQEPPQHEQAWASGAAGEEALADSLTRRCPEALILHDRRLPGRRTNIDHLVVVPSGVYVIDAKRYKGSIKVQRPLFGKEKLVIAGRDKTKLVEGLKRQVEAVRKGLALIESPAPLHGCFCFVNPPGQAGGSGIPLLRTLTVEGVPLFYPKRLAKRLNQPGDLAPEDILVVGEALAELFPPA